jgi:two-component system phosphate regulon sensor histidine kinase PhoR
MMTRMSTFRTPRGRRPGRGVVGGVVGGVLGSGIAAAAAMVVFGSRHEREARVAAEARRDAGIREAAATAALERAELLQHQVVAGASHELRTSLTAVIGFAQLLSSESVGPINDQQRVLLERLEASGQRQLRLVEDLIVLGQADGGELQVRMVPLDVRFVVRRAIADAQESLGRRRLRISLETGADPLVAVADQEHLTRVVRELVDNAVKFTADGGRIEVTCERRDGDVVVAVVDSGVGIAPEDVRRVTGRFVRGRNAIDAALPGAGVGLAVVHDLVAAHGGGVHVDSRPGGGTRVEISLPAAPGQEGAAGSSSAETRAMRTSSSKGLTR